MKYRFPIYLTMAAASILLLSRSHVVRANITQSVCQNALTDLCGPNPATPPKAAPPCNPTPSPTPPPCGSAVYCEACTGSLLPRTQKSCIASLDPTETCTVKQPVVTAACGILYSNACALDTDGKCRCPMTTDGSLPPNSTQIGVCNYYECVP